MTPWLTLPDATFYVGDCRQVLAALPEKSVHCCVTSIPYFGLRDYGLEPVVWDAEPSCSHSWDAGSQGRRRDDQHLGKLDGIERPSHQAENRYGCAHEWGTWDEAHDVREEALSGKSRTTERFYVDPSRKFDGNHQKHRAGSFCRHCSAWLGCLGLEPTPELFVQHIVEVFRAVWRVLRDDGTLWLNIGDSYSSGNRSDYGPKRESDKQASNGAIKDTPRPRMPDGIKAKDLLLMPARVALALQADGWYVRSQIIWAKKAPMPESVTDRPTSAHETIWLLSKRSRYYYDAEVVREAAGDWGDTFKTNGKYGGEGAPLGAHHGLHERQFALSGRNQRNVWHLSPEPFPEAHFATFPTEIPRRAILAGTSERGVCGECGAPWARETKPSGDYARALAAANNIHAWDGQSALAKVTAGNEFDKREGLRVTKDVTTLGWSPQCTCNAPTIPATVIDPFSGSGTVSLVARQIGRRSIYIDQSPAYAEMARKRVEQQTPSLPISAVTPHESPTQLSLTEATS